MERLKFEQTIKIWNKLFVYIPYIIKPNPIYININRVIINKQILE